MNFFLIAAVLAAIADAAHQSLPSISQLDANRRYDHHLTLAPLNIPHADPQHPPQPQPHGHPPANPIPYAQHPGHTGPLRHHGHPQRPLPSTNHPQQHQGTGRQRYNPYARTSPGRPGLGHAGPQQPQAPPAQHPPQPPPGHPPAYQLQRHADHPQQPRVRRYAVPVEHEANQQLPPLRTPSPHHYVQPHQKEHARAAEANRLAYHALHRAITTVVSNQANNWQDVANQLTLERDHARVHYHFHKWGEGEQYRPKDWPTRKIKSAAAAAETSRNQVLRYSRLGDDVLNPHHG